MNAEQLVDLLLFGAGGGFVIGALPVERLVDAAMRWLGWQKAPIRTAAVALGNGAKGIAGLVWLLFTAIYVYPRHRTIVGGHGDYGLLLQNLRPWIESGTWALVISTCHLGQSLLYWLGSTDDLGTGPLTLVVAVLWVFPLTRGLALSLALGVVACVGSALCLMRKARSWAAAVVALNGLASALLLVVAGGNFGQDGMMMLATVGVVVANLLFGDRWRRRRSLASPEDQEE